MSWNLTLISTKIAENQKVVHAHVTMHNFFKAKAIEPKFHTLKALVVVYNRVKFHRICLVGWEDTAK